MTRETLPKWVMDISIPEMHKRFWKEYLMEQGRMDMTD